MVLFGAAASPGAAVVRPTHLRRTAVAGCSTRGGHAAFSIRAESGKVYTIVGPGGAGKTTAAIALAKSLTANGTNTILCISSDDRSADDLLGHDIPVSTGILNIGASAGRDWLPDPVGGLQAVRLTPLTLVEEMFTVIKKGDERFNVSGGNLDLSPKELSVIPGLESYLTLATLRRAAANGDTVVFDGPSSADVLRMVGAPTRLSWYIRKLSKLISKSDLGRVVAPTLQDLLGWAITQEPGYAGTKGEGGDSFEAIAALMDTGADVFAMPARGATLVVADGSNPYSIKSARRMQGLAMQQGAHIGGAMVLGVESCGDFTGLPTVCMPRFEGDWAPLVAAMPADIQEATQAGDLPKGIVIDQEQKEVRIYLPGFLKSEVKLSQPKGGDELLVDAGGQRKHVPFPPGFQGKVKGAKFEDEVLKVTIA